MPKAPLKLISYTTQQAGSTPTYAYLASRPGNRWHAVWIGKDPALFEKSKACQEWHLGIDRIGKS